VCLLCCCLGKRGGMGLVPAFPRVAGCLDIDVWGSSDAQSRSVTFLNSVCWRLVSCRRCSRQKNTKDPFVNALLLTKNSLRRRLLFLGGFELIYVLSFSEFHSPCIVSKKIR